MYKNYVSRILFYIVIWIIALAFFTFLREFGQDVLKDYTSLKIFQQIVVHLILGIFAGILFGSIQIVFEKYIFKKIAFGAALLVGSLGYLLAIFALLSLAIFVFSGILEEELHINFYRELLLSKEVVPIIVYCFLVASLINFLSEVDKKFGPGNLRKMLSGKFYKPKEEERIFMFLDLRSSTSIAERLGHIKYSELIQDCFQDISIVKKYKAEIYQYVGDEAVLTWEKEKGLKNNRCIKTYLAFQEKIYSKRKYYSEKYEVVPEFKAGMHLGIITVAEVGEYKREIAYHGDTINIASRIQNECNILGKDFLISEDIKKQLGSNDGFDLKFEGNIQLKGKTEAMRIYSLNSV